MKETALKISIEFILLYVLLPLLLLFPINEGIKISALLIGIIYVIYISYSRQLIKKQELFQWKTINYWRPLIFRFLALIVLTIGFMYFVDKENLFLIVRKNPMLWIVVVLFYSIFSVYPQEFLYRKFFFSRYNSLFSNKKIFFLINGIVFSMAHLVFSNFLVLGLTFVGGIVFAITYDKTKSLSFICLEHAIYGSWLFTVGMGEMLAFPLSE